MGKVELKIEIDADLLARAQAAGVSLDAVLETGLMRVLADPANAETRARRWTEENAEAIAQYNARIKRRGVFGADLRRW